jgi:signal transduction histidine kinase
LHRALDLELALMLDTYRLDSAARVDASARLAAVGQITASIGHELRNPLGVVESSLYLLRQRLGKMEIRDSVVEKHAVRMQEQLRACSNTIASLLDMVREVPLSRSRFGLASLLRECLERTPAPDGVTVQVDVEDSLLVDADREQLAAVISNLLRNAFEAVAGVDVKWARLEARGVAGGVQLELEDSGAGVDAAHRAHIFDVLFTTRARGTGLGLALCKKIVERHGGELQLLPSSGKGARFRVWLPTLPALAVTGGLDPSS